MPISQSMLAAPLWRTRPSQRPGMGSGMMATWLAKASAVARSAQARMWALVAPSMVPPMSGSRPPRPSASATATVSIGASTTGVPAVSPVAPAAAMVSSPWCLVPSTISGSR